MTRIGAFFDVDETLISVKSMVDFLEFYLARPHADENTGLRWRAAQFRAAAGDPRVPREEVNRRYYRIYAGERTDTLAELGRAWFTRRRREPGFVHAPVVAALIRHRQAGHRVVLVSGSMPACLDPLAETLEVRDVLCTRQLVDDTGRYTGAIAGSVIGEGKRNAARFLAARTGLSLPLSFGYADDASDIPLLSLLGHPVVVGEEAGLVDHAGRHGWPRFPPMAVGSVAAMA
jgi:HAD superfamily hydrolase (TIGR01490 family)